MLVKDVMTPSVVSVGPDETVEGMAHALLRHRISAVSVVDGDRLVGIVSRADRLRGLAARGTQGAAAPSESDRDLRDRILRDIEKRAHAPAGSVAVIVVRGSAYLWGIAQTQQDKDAIRAAAEEVVGAEKVHDFLSTLPGVLRRTL